MYVIFAIDNIADIFVAFSIVISPPIVARELDIIIVDMTRVVDDSVPDCIVTIPIDITPPLTPLLIAPNGSEDRDRVARIASSAIVVNVTRNKIDVLPAIHVVKFHRFGDERYVITRKRPGGE